MYWDVEGKVLLQVSFLGKIFEKCFRCKGDILLLILIPEMKALVMIWQSYPFFGVVQVQRKESAVVVWNQIQTEHKSVLSLATQVDKRRHWWMVRRCWCWTQGPGRDLDDQICWFETNCEVKNTHGRGNLKIENELVNQEATKYERQLLGLSENVLVVCLK